MADPTLVLIDLQRDFYHPEGSYGRAHRPLEPIQQTIQRLLALTSRYPNAVRIGARYAPGQFPVMPRLCSDPDGGGAWHPKLQRGPLLTKQKRSGFDVLREYFARPVPLILAGVCTHRCVKATLDDLRRNQWPVRVLERATASCGLRWNKHKQSIRRWRRQGLTSPTLAQALDDLPHTDLKPEGSRNSIPQRKDDGNVPFVS